MGLVIVLSRFIKRKRSGNEATMTYSGYCGGIKIKKIIVFGIYETIEKDVMYLVTLKGARIERNVLCGELLKIKRLDEVNF